jgi:hypothetical protein
VPEWSHNPKLESILAVWAKPWATLGDNVSAVAAASALRDSGVNPADILEMKVTIWRHYAEYPGTGYAGPFDSVAQALASTAFGVSAMLALGELDYSVSVKRRKDPNILRLVHCVTVEPHDGEWHEATIEAKLRDGRIVQRTCADGPRELMFHQPQTAVALFEDRLRVSGSRPGVGAALAAQVFEVAQGHAQMSIRKLVDMMELACATLPALAAPLIKKYWRRVTQSKSKFSRCPRLASYSDIRSRRDAYLAPEHYRN